MRFKGSSAALFFLTLAMNLTVILNSCGASDPLKSSKVNEKDIFRAYTLTYEESSQATSLLVKFLEKSVNGSSITLDQGSSISAQDDEQRFLGQSPRALSNGSAGYMWSSGAATKNNSYSLSWTTPSGVVVTDTVKLPTPIRPVLATSSFSRSAGIVLRFDRDLDPSNMTVRVAVKGLLDGTATSATVTGEVISGGSILFGNADLQRFALGTITIELQTESQKNLPAAVSSGVSGAATGIFVLGQTAAQLLP